MKQRRIMCFLLMGCEVPLRELADAIARPLHTIDVEFLPNGAARPRRHAHA